MFLKRNSAKSMILRFNYEKLLKTTNKKLMKVLLQSN